ncbi:Tc toxin subunit A [Mycetohabitans endofungorum]|uniref:Tc toxin subunit A n=1 Tax=Mycetohabitans endofungorum TaxID=417203 RepID=UPI002B057DF9|nr:Tc toxin subunit A [Mycetohabitans endofungorum]
MDTLTSRLIARVEQLHELPEELAKLGYHSVFDVVHVPRERFIRLHRNTLGRRAEKMYDLAIGYAHQVVHHFRYNRVTRAVKSTLRGPFSVAGPDFKNQFKDTDWQEKAPNGALEANDGPAAYLTYLYALALKQEKTDDSQLMNTLADRRPDLGELKVDDAALNEVIPQLQLVNEILAAAIKKSPDAIKKSQLAKIQNIEQSNGLDTVNELLAITRYPNNLPYHYGHQQIQAAQSVLGLTLQEVLLPHTGSFPRRFWNVTDALLEKDVEALNRLQIMASQLAPEQQKIIIEKTSDWSKFYQENYGEAYLNANSFADMDVFTARTGLTVPQVEQLLCTTAGGVRVVLSENVKEGSTVGPYLYGACFIHADKPENITISRNQDSGALTLDKLTDDKMDRINRIVRLQKWLELPYEDVDLLVTSAMRAEEKANDAFSMNDNTLRMLGVFKHYQTTYGVSAKQFAAWLYEVTPYAITPNTPFFDQVFNASGAFDTPFVVDNQQFVYTATTGKDGAQVQHISTALGLSHRQFLLLADRIACQNGDVIESKLPCNLSIVSAFYRLTTLARTLGFSVEAFCVMLDRLNVTGGPGLWEYKGKLWQQLAGQPSVKQLAESDVLTSDVLSLLQALSTIAQWQHQHQLPMQVMQLLTLPPAGYYGIVSTGDDHMQLVSVSWKDLSYDSDKGELELTQQIALRRGQTNTYGISKFQYALPKGLSRNRNADLSWQGDGPNGVTLQNDKYDGTNNGDYSDWPIWWDGTWWKPDPKKTYFLNIPLKGNFKDLSKLNALSSTLKIHTYAFDTNLTFSEGAILTENMGLAAQGTTDQLNFIRQVCNSLANTLITNAAQLNRSGAPVKDKTDQPIDWLSLLSATDVGLIDADGLVTDVDIVTAVKKVAEEKTLSDKKDAICKLTNTLQQAQQTQRGVAVGLLAQSLNVSQSLPALLLRWSGQTVYRLLSATWALKKTVQTAANIPADYLCQLREVVRCALLTTQFALSPALVQTLLDHPEYFGFTKENVSRIDLQTLYLLSRYHDLLTQVGAVHGGTEDDVLAYLRAANATPPLNNTEAAKLLAPLLGWEQNEALHACDMFDGKVAKTIAQLDTVLRLQQAQKQTGLSVQQQRQGFLLNRDSAYEDWQSAGRALVTGVSHLKGNL